MSLRRAPGKAISFADWLDSSEYRGSPTAFARANGLSRTTVQHWVRGRGIGQRYAAKLRAITGIEHFGAVAPDRALYPGERKETERHARRIKELVNELGDELLHFRDKSARHRALLRERLDLSAVHKIANLLLLFMDEQRYTEYRDLNRTFKRLR